MRIHFSITTDHFMQRPQQKGASMVEALIAVPIIIVACMLTLQMMLLYRAKITLNYATQEAARIGSTSNGRTYPRFIPGLSDFIAMAGKTKTNSQASAIQRPALPTSTALTTDGAQPTGPAFQAGSSGSTAQAGTPPVVPATPAAPSKNYFMALGKGLLSYGDSSVLQGFIAGMTPYYTKGTGFNDIVKGQLTAYGDAMMNSCILYHNPTQSAFLDFGFMEMEGPDKYIYQIPNDLMRYRIPGDVDAAGKGIGYYKKKGKYLSNETTGLNQGMSVMNVQDATLLSIEIKYSAEMKVPIAREIIVGITKLYNTITENETGLGRSFVNNALDHGRWPMSSFATYRMRSPVHWSVFYPFGTAMSNSPMVSEISVQKGIKELWNTVFDLIPEDNNNQKKWDPAEPQIGFCPGLMVEAIGISTGDTLNADRWVGVDYDKNLKSCSSGSGCP